MGISESGVGVGAFMMIDGRVSAHAGEQSAVASCPELGQSSMVQLVLGAAL
jgi:hypothetical protein